MKVSSSIGFPQCGWKARDAPVPGGDYVFVAHRWSFAGLRTDHVLAYRAKALDAGDLLSPALAEELVVTAARRGQPLSNPANVLGDIQRIGNGALSCEEALGDAFGTRLEAFEAENERRCSQQETSARSFAARRMGELRERLARYRAQGKLRPTIPMTEGLLVREETQLQTKLKRIRERRRVDSTLVPLATGVVRVH